MNKCGDGGHSAVLCTLLHYVGSLLMPVVSIPTVSG